MSAEPNPDALTPYWAAGFELIRLSCPGTKNDPSAGKRPIGRWRQAVALDTKQAFRHMESGGNIGVRLRPVDLVVDVDTHDPERNGRKSFTALCLDHGLDPMEFPSVITGSGGRHYYMSKPPGLFVVGSLEKYPGIDFKTFGGQVVSAGSVHKCGRIYNWEPGALLAERAAAPASLLEALRRAPPSKADGGGSLSAETVAWCLAQLNPVKFRDQTRWLEIMMACHHASGGAAGHEFVEWSTQDPKYAEHGRLILRRWESLTPDKGITQRTLFKAIQDAGGELPPETGADEDFEPVADEPPEAAKPTADDETPEESLDALGRMNRDFCVVPDDGRFRVFRAVRGADRAIVGYERLSRSDFESFALNLPAVEVPGAGGRSEVVPVAKWWLGNPRRREYIGVDFVPNGPAPADRLNLWCGWPLKPRAGRWDYLRELVEDVACGGDSRSVEYVLNWFAFLFQRPEVPAEVALVFKGPKGSGKSTIGNALLSITGRTYGKYVNSSEALTNKFNATFMHRVYVFADEAVWGGDKRGESALKGLITQESYTYEPKGREQVDAKNMVHLVMTSNEAWAVPAGADHERRYFVLEMPRRDRWTLERFDKLQRQLNAGGHAALFHDMLRRDIKGWHPRRDFYQTDALVQQALHGLGAVDKWWVDVLRSGHLPGATAWGPDTVVALETLFDSYRQAHRENNDRGPISNEHIGARLKQLIPPLRRVQLTSPTSAGLRTDMRGRATFYVLPSQADCREYYSRCTGLRLSWEDEEDILS